MADRHSELTWSDSLQRLGPPHLSPVPLFWFVAGSRVTRDPRVLAQLWRAGHRSPGPPEVPGLGTGALAKKENNCSGHFPPTGSLT